MIEKKSTMQVYTGGKRYTGGVSGTGHSWTLTGVEIYESIRKKLLSEKENYKNIHFNCKRKEEKKLGLADVLNNEDSEDFRAMLIDGEMNIEDILASGQFAKV